MARCGGGGDHAATGEHHLRRRQPGVARAVRQALEVATQERGQRRIDHRGRTALVLAEDAGGLVCGRHVPLGAVLSEELGHAALVRGVAEAPQEADRRGLEVAVEAFDLGQQAVLVELLEHAVGTGAFGNGHAQLPRDERRRVPGAQPVQLGAGLAAELLDVGEAGRGEERGPRDSPLEQRVGSNRHAVYEPLHVGRAGAGAVEHRLDGGEDALRLVPRRARSLRGGQAVVMEERGVGERAANVDPEEHGLMLRAPPSLRTERSDVARGAAPGQGFRRFGESST